MLNANNTKEIARTEFDGKLMRRLVEFDGRTPAGENVCRNHVLPPRWCHME